MSQLCAAFLFNHSLGEYLCNVAAAGNDLQQLEQHVKKLNER